MKIVHATLGLALAFSLTACEALTLQTPADKTQEEARHAVVDDTSQSGADEATGDAATQKRTADVMASEVSSEESGYAPAPDTNSLLFTNPEWPVCKATEGFPTPEFSGPIVSSSMSESKYSSSADASWENVPEDEVVAYLETLRQAGFTYDTSISRSAESFSYSASDAETETAETIAYRTVNLYYYRNYSEYDSEGSDYTLNISIWQTDNAGDPGMIAYDTGEARK